MDSSFGVTDGNVWSRVPFVPQGVDRALALLIRIPATLLLLADLEAKRYHQNFDRMLRITESNFERMLSTPQTPSTRLAAWFMRRTTASAVRRVAPLNAAIASDVGVVRDENQDRVALVHGSDRNGSPFILAALADGIGGMKQGAECAALTLATFINAVIYEAQQTVDTREWLENASFQADRAVHGRQAGEGGSTLAAILFPKGRPAVWLSVGDSRVYHTAQAKMTQLSRDDTLEGQLGKPIEGGRRSELLQFIGIGEGLEPHIEAVPSDLSGALLLTTDGVHFIDADYLGKVAYYAQDLGVCARRFMELAKMLGGPDNASVVALSIEALSEASMPQVDSAYEVWDPFGELHMIFDRNCRYAPIAPLHASRNKVKEANSLPLTGDAVRIASGRAESVNSKPPEPAPCNAAVSDKPSKQKGKSGRKAKGKDINGDEERKAEGEAPQLFIEFPFKAP